VASSSRLLKIIGLFCKRALLNRRYSAKETYSFKEPTNHSHPIPGHPAHYQQTCMTKSMLPTTLWPHQCCRHYINVAYINMTTSMLPSRPPLWIVAKYWRAGLAEMPLGNWYPAGTHHFHRQISVGRKWRSQLCWVIKAVPHDLVRRIRFRRIKSSEQEFEYLYWTISKILCWNLFTSNGTSIIHWVRVGRTTSMLPTSLWLHQCCRHQWLHRCLL